MKWFKRATKYECEIAPRARVLILTVLTDNDDKRTLMLAFRTPFKRWQKYINPWHFGHAEGWCTYNFAFKYNYMTRKISFLHFWEPVDV